MNRNIIIFLLTITTCGIFYSMPIPLYPRLAISKGYSDSYIGIIFAMYAVVNLFLIPFIAKLIARYSRFNLLLISFTTMIISTICFLVLDYISNSIVFTVISIIARSLQGASIEFISILIFSLTVLISDPEEAHDNLGYAEMALTFGKILGPLVVLLFDSYGYPTSFIVALIIDAFALILLMFGLSVSKETLNKTGEEDVDFSYIRYIKHFFKLSDSERKIRRYKSDENINKKLHLALSIDSKKHSAFRKKLTKNSNELAEIINDSDVEIKDINEESDTNSFSFFISSIFNKLIFFTFLSAIVDFTSAVFFIPVYTVEMDKRFNMSEQTSSLFLSIYYAFYVIGLRFIIMFNNLFTARFMICMGLILNSISISFYSPFPVYPYSMYLSIIGFSMQNFFGGNICLNAIIDLTESYKKLGLSEFKANDLASALYFLSINFAELIGPLIGGVLTSMYNFEFACFTVGCLNIFTSLIFFIFNYKGIYDNLSFSFKQKTKH